MRKAIKQMNGSFWHPNQKLWSLVNTEANFRQLKHLCNGEFILKKDIKFSPIPKIILNEKGTKALYDLEKTLVLKHYGASSIRTYKKMLKVFLAKFINRNLKTITKEDIEGFVYELIQKNKISESYQNQLINAIKAYYEHVLGMPREYYDVKRPKKAVSIPNVLSQQEVLKIIQNPQNIKHRAILWTIYSAGLRISELINLRITDMHSLEGYLFIKDSKGKKDRKTILSPQLVKLLRAYYKANKPSYWLFEGQTGGQHSVTSIRAIFRRAVRNTNSNPWSTVHTLRHSFATHCIEQINELFPNYRIYGENNEGIEYSIEGKRIDILLENSQGNLLAIELKSGITNYKIFGQLSMYLGLLMDKFPNKEIRGCIVAGEIDKTLKSGTKTTELITLKTYRMKLELQNE